MTNEEARTKAQTLLDYFRELPPEHIHQPWPALYGDSNKACFGAHVARALGVEIRSDAGAVAYTYTDGKQAMSQIVGSYPPFRWKDYGAPEPFGARAWDRNPYDVLSDIFHDIGIIEKEVKEPA